LCVAHAINSIPKKVASVTTGPHHIISENLKK